MKNLTTAQIELLQDMLTVYKEHLENKENNVRDFISLAHLSGDIESSGSKYADNKNVWDIRDNIIKHLEEINTNASKMIYSILNN